MSALAGPFGTHADILARWRSQLAGIEVPARGGASFAHIRCNHSALWVVKFLLTELVTSRGTRQESPWRVVVYALPDPVSVDIVKMALRGDSNLNNPNGVRVMTYTDLNRDLSDGILPAYLQSAFVVFDTDFGRVPAQLIVSATKLFVLWARVKERLRGCAAATISPHNHTVWSSLAATYEFGKDIVFVDFGPDLEAQWEVHECAVPDAVDKLVEVILTLASKHETAAIVCRVSGDQGAAVQKTLKQDDKRAAFDLQGPLESLLLTPANFESQRAALSALEAHKPAHFVLLVDCSLRFVPAIGRRCHYVVPPLAHVVDIDPKIGQVVEFDGAWTLHDLTFECGLAESGMSSENRVNLVVSNASTFRLRARPNGPVAWKAWGSGLAETLFCLVAQLDEERSMLTRLPLASTDSLDFNLIVETTRLLRMMKLVQGVPGENGSQHPWYQRLTIAGSRAKRAAYFLTTGIAETLPESILLAEIDATSSTAVKLTLAAAASAIRIGITNIVKRGLSPIVHPTLQQCRAACTGVGAQLGHKGRLWVVIGILARDIDSPVSPRQDTTWIQSANLTVSGAGRDQFRRRFRLIVERVAPTLAALPFPERLTPSEIEDVEAALVRAWLQHLSLIPRHGGSGGSVDQATQFMIRRSIHDSALCQWGNGLHAPPGSHFAIHFGLNASLNVYTTDSLTLVSTDAVLRVLASLFSSSEASRASPYLELLVTSHRN